ncbi:MAG: ABC transporter substrate-binding protein [Armatimonadota bacterium]|nr:ABC transporter substrate-binding protein [Armatimonadota bacterium]
MQRRAVIVTAVVFGLIALVLAPAGGQARPLRVAMLSSLSGPFTFWGVNVRDGMRMAVEELNTAGGVLGRPVELLERDDRNNPAEAISAFRALVEREGVAAVGGILGSDVGLALSREAELLRVPVFLNRAGAHTILQRTTRYTFRTCLVSSPMYVQASAALMRYAKYTRIGAVIADYGWGHSYMEWLRRFVATIPGMRLQLEVAPVATSDFTPYLRRVQAVDPQFLDVGGHPPGNAVLVRQAAELGMTQQMFGAANPPELVVQRAGEAAFGRYVDYTCADVSHPTFRRLGAKFYGAYRRYFDDNAFSGYVTVRMVADAAVRANTTDPRQIADVIRRGRFVQPGYGWPLSYTEWGEMREARPFLFSLQRGEAPGGICPGCGWVQKVEFRTPPLEPYVPEQ